MAKQPLVGNLQNHREFFWEELAAQGQIKYVPFKIYLPAILYSDVHIIFSVKEKKYLRETDKRRGGKPKVTRGGGFYNC